MDIALKPSAIFALIKSAPYLMGTAGLLYGANRYETDLIWFSLLGLLFAVYRYLYIRSAIYLVTAQYIRISRGILFKQIDTVELFRVKGYCIIEPLLLQLFRLMDVHLQTTDPENPIIWLRGIPQSDIIDVIRERVLETRRQNQLLEIN